MSAESYYYRLSSHIDGSKEKAQSPLLLIAISIVNNIISILIPVMKIVTVILMALEKKILKTRGEGNQVRSPRHTNWFLCGSALVENSACKQHA